MQRFLFIPILAIGLASCSSSSSDSGLTPDASGANQVSIKKDGSNNPFAFKKEDIQSGDNGRITGGKRSQYEMKSESAYAKANAQTPNHLQKSYQKQAWSGSRDYSTGSYKAGANRESGRKSWFGRRRAKNANRVANAAGQGYATGSYGTSQANETGKIRKTGSSGYVDEQAGDGWRKIPIMEREEYRSLTMGQTRSLLGR